MENVNNNQQESNIIINGHPLYGAKDGTLPRPCELLVKDLYSLTAKDIDNLITILSYYKNPKIILTPLNEKEGDTP